nr:MAG TPA: hypothetical protein [Caudoviricetes sp.]
MKNCFPSVKTEILCHPLPNIPNEPNIPLKPNKPIKPYKCSLTLSLDFFLFLEYRRG